MREILFRGKALSKHGVLKQNNGWVYGVPVPVEINTCETKRVEIVKCHGYDELDYYELLSEDDEVDPETVGQWTGLVDKNGKKIFEGDYVRYRDLTTNQEKIDLVEWNETHASFIRLHKSLLGLQYLYIDEALSARCEVIGNIWDNPELLEKRSDYL